MDRDLDLHPYQSTTTVNIILWANIYNCWFDMIDGGADPNRFNIVANGAIADLLLKETIFLAAKLTPGWNYIGVVKQRFSFWIDTCQVSYMIAVSSTVGTIRIWTRNLLREVIKDWYNRVIFNHAPRWTAPSFFPFKKYQPVKKILFDPREGF